MANRLVDVRADDVEVVEWVLAAAAAADAATAAAAGRCYLWGGFVTFVVVECAQREFSEVDVGESMLSTPLESYLRSNVVVAVLDSVAGCLVGQNVCIAGGLGNVA